MYKNTADAVDSFCEAGKRNAMTASTFRFYNKQLLKTSHLYVMNHHTYRLSDMFENQRRQKLCAVFEEYYDIRPMKLRSAADANIRGRYGSTDIPVYMLWDLSPSVLASAIGYACQKGFGINDKVYLLCFEEDVKLVSEILNLIETDRSDGWDVLGEVENDPDMAMELAATVIRNTGGAKSDPFWNDAEMNILKAVILLKSVGEADISNRTGKKQTLGDVYHCHESTEYTPSSPRSRGPRGI